MRSRVVTAGALACVLLTAACEADSSEAEAASSTTADLLAQPITDGMSTPLAVDGSLIQDGGPRVRVTGLGFDRGEASAPVKVLELSDFGCIYCRQFHQETFPTLLEEFIETGMVEWKFVPFITGIFPNSLAATQAGECVLEQSGDAFELISDRIWTEQGEWKRSDDPEPLLRSWVTDLGIDMDSFDSCLTEDRRLNRIASATTLARQVGVRGTPTFVILGYPPLQGALPLELFQQILTEVHRDATERRDAVGDAGN